MSSVVRLAGVFIGLQDITSNELQNNLLLLVTINKL